MPTATNGAAIHQANGSSRPTATSRERVARRIVLLLEEEQSEISEVLLEMTGDDISGKRLHAEIQKHAAVHTGRWVAAEWQGSLRWVRFLWCRK